MPAVPPRAQEGFLRQIVGGVGIVAQAECKAIDARHPRFEIVTHRLTASSTVPDDRRASGRKVKQKRFAAMRQWGARWSRAPLPRRGEHKASFLVPFTEF